MNSQDRLLYIIRHAESEANASGTFAARVIDPELSPRGAKDAERIAQRLSQEKLQRIYTSPLRRSIQTAKLLASRCGTDIEVLEDLREVNVGVLDGKSSRSKRNWDLYERVLERWSAGDLDSRFEGGESLGEVCRRARNVLRLLHHQPSSGVTALISHAVFLMLFLPLLLNDSLANLKLYSLPRGSITAVRLQGRRARLKELGNIQHLKA